MGYVRNAWYVAAWADQVEQDKPISANILGEPIVLWRSEGKVVAMEDRCPHRQAPLSLGRCEEASLRCMYHGLRFDAEGKCIEIPGQETIPPLARVRTYPAIEKHSWIWVWPGDPDQAREAEIPSAVGVDDPDWLLGRGQLDYDAEARLINDNLLDLSHVTFVHAASLQGGPEFAGSLPTVTQVLRGLRFQRWMVGTTTPSGGESRRSEAPIDDYMTYDFLIPGILLMYTGSFPAGTAEACNFGEPDRSLAVGGVSFSSQAVTPTGDKTARYFFSAGPHRAFGNEEVRNMQINMALMAFAEDKVMIEAQQKVIDRAPDRIVIPTSHDRSVTQFNRMVDKLAREEKELVSLAG
jgi:phenylpropionate dioxygenase-like ring-hydroxylating dioxygenase large terminal subunit